MKRGSSALLAALLAGAALQAPAPARAQTAQDRESARGLFEQGKAQRDRGDAAGALESFRAADALMNVPTTKLAVARAFLALGQLVEARDAAMMVAQIPVATSEPAPFTDARAAAAQLASEVGRRIPSVAIAIEGKTPESLTVDGVAIPSQAWSAPRRVNPGKHTVMAKVGSREVTQEVVVAEGENTSIALDTHDLRAPDAPATTATADHPALARPLGAIFWVGAGAGAAGIAVGTVAGILSLSNKSQADSFCRDNKCPPAAYSSLDAANTWATVSTVAFAVAGAGAVLAGVGLLLHPSPASPTTAAIVVQPGGAYLAGSF
jgi:hypothetical protein